MDRRHFIAGLAGTALATSTSPLLAQSAAPKELRIGFQKNGVLLIAKQQGVLEKRFASQGIAVKWVEFQFGPPLLEALNVGSIEYGPTGDAPPVFAQAAKANLLYVATQEAAGSGSAILVPPKSTIQTLADLKGKRVAFAKASSSHNLTIAAIEKAGIGYDEFTPVYLAPADARAAFERGAVDAWTIWDPFFALAETIPGVRVLAPAKGIVAQNSFYLANRDFTGKNPQIISTINEELAKVALWAETNRGEVAGVQAAATGLPLDVWQRAVDRTEFEINPLNDRVLTVQQSVADRFHKLGLIPKPINVRDLVWDWKPSA
ncbi:sulfonate ABC transporter substrate-binding protein [Bosea caraganae]|uniref:Putative aliphatic sulfonates-binding protein n=1 Tax=Bosea caraganae TaxID=2763117 RepID=A0A370L151_9HYPH|nr:sulfonate ABC transporter substrate-binding protein [Bosea caraganae]RDJ21244.1 sulfonate ABC transporter substrate-binding protein [Bosea caraganae]RDJ26384.1 sulfonate ABC transporter substrate-binding protein [Bosea caraganae]